jgi:hypothetical protein
MSEPQRRRPLRSEDGAGFGEVVHVAVDDERGTVQLFAVVLDYPLDGSGIRQAQVRQLAPFVSSPGYTWSNRNPVAAVGLYPDRRFDCIFSAWPRRHGVGHPIRCSLLGVRPPDQDQISDHYGLVAELRY